MMSGGDEVGVGVVTWDADGDGDGDGLGDGLGDGDDAQAATRSPATIAVATGQRWGAPRS